MGLVGQPYIKLLKIIKCKVGGTCINDLRAYCMTSLLSHQQQMRQLRKDN